jgi:hypothetical protein
VLLDNPYVFADFWRFQNGTLPEPAWKASFAAANKAAHVALGRQDWTDADRARGQTVPHPKTEGGKTARGDPALSGAAARSAPRRISPCPAR